MTETKIKVLKLIAVCVICIGTVTAIVLLTTTCKKSSHGHKAQKFMHKMNFEKLAMIFESPKRQKWQKPEQLISYMKVKDSDVIADIGAGTGYFSFRLIKHARKVLAVDIDEKFLQYLREKKSKLDSKDAEKIDIRQTVVEKTGLSEGEADIIMSVDTYHHFVDRINYLKKLKASLKPDGILYIIDFKEGKLAVGPPADHKISGDIIKKELLAAGFRVDVNSTLLPYQYIFKATQ